MSKIVLISCSKSKHKLPHKVKAEFLYSKSTLFSRSLEYAKLRQPDKIFILSAKYGLVDLEQELEWYEQRLSRYNDEENRRWAEKVIKQMQNKMIDFENDEVIFLAGKDYTENLLGHFRKKPEEPLQGLRPPGKRLKELNKQIQYLKGLRSV